LCHSFCFPILISVILIPLKRFNLRRIQFVIRNREFVFFADEQIIDVEVCAF